MSYPLPKLDMVAVPDFGGGAMENNGLIIYRENFLLHDAIHSTVDKKQTVSLQISRYPFSYFGLVAFFIFSNETFCS